MSILNITNATREGAHSALEWRIIPRYPLYEASSDGQIRRRREFARYASKGNPLKQTKINGYPVVCLGLGKGKHITVCVHALVCEAFHGPRPSGHETAHCDGIPGNVNANNLRWATRKDNQNDRLRHGTAINGEASPFAKLTASQVKEIRALWPLLPRNSTGKRVADGATRAMEERFGMPRDTLYRAARGTTWSHL